MPSFDRRPYLIGAAIACALFLATLALYAPVRRHDFVSFDDPGYVYRNAHVLGGVIFLAFSAMTHALWRSALVAALFAFHPLHVESVAWISERKDVLSTVFAMLALLAWARYARRPAATSYLAALAFFALGLMAKPMLVTLPFLLLLVDLWPLGRMQSEDEGDGSGPPVGP